MEIIAQATTLFGVVVGAMTAYAITTFTERARWRREDSMRWDKERLSAYLEWLDAIKAIISISSRLVRGQGIASRATPIDREAGLPLLDQAELTRSMKFEGVLLLGDASTIAAAQTVNEAAWMVADIASGHLEPTAESWLLAFRNYRKAREMFYDHARSSMNVPVARTHLSHWTAPPEAAAGRPYGIRQSMQEREV